MPDGLSPDRKPRTCLARPSFHVPIAPYRLTAELVADLRLRFRSMDQCWHPDFE
ncbi:hypothetical protein [[Phormidium] sp. ETS-05]|uniref:hypothetical protein n=1 Tax=[Phormidium] sp. ETS-05 TaxID=222819 RepID=UPI0018EF3000|nr:hypothetical protein [[Phormidium] sp. ETS-05]